MIDIPVTAPKVVTKNPLSVSQDDGHGQPVRDERQPHDLPGEIVDQHGKQDPCEHQKKHIRRFHDQDEDDHHGDRLERPRQRWAAGSSGVASISGIRLVRRLAASSLSFISLTHRLSSYGLWIAHDLVGRRVLWQPTSMPARPFRRGIYCAFALSQFRNQRQGFQPAAPCAILSMAVPFCHRF